MPANPKADFFFRNESVWKAEVTQLRRIVLATGLTEIVRWGCPTYAVDDGNTVLIHTFKHYCALLFFKGALMADPESLLIQQSKNVQSARQMRFTSLDQINALEASITAYVREAIRVEKSGAQVTLKKTPQFEMPEAFKTRLDEMPELKTAFEALTPGRQRAYLLHFAGAKQAKTRAARVEKYIQHILAGKGLDDE
jgi:uncharacterized protein YdeI (YjbR/CyaY-like superfamily)